MIAIIAALDTKGDKAAYLNQIIKKMGMETLVIDTGILGSPFFKADIPREKVAQAAGQSLASIASGGDETLAIKAMAEGASKIVGELNSSGKLEGIVGIGGTLAISLWLSIMKNVPMGVPKVLCCSAVFITFSQPQLFPPDLIVVPTVSDIWGLNSITRSSLEKTAGAIVGAATSYKEGNKVTEKSLLAISTLGTSTLTYIIPLTRYFEEAGYEVAAFHIGQGYALEQLVRQGLVSGVLDLSLMELSNEICGAPFFPKSSRFEAAGEKGVPQVIAPGAVGCLSWWGPQDTIPERFKDRTMRQHGELAWMIEMSFEEVAETGKVIASRLNKGRGPRVVVLPKQGFLEMDKPGQMFHNPERGEVFSKALKTALNAEVDVIELDVHINDQQFADEVAKVFVQMTKPQ